MTFQRRHTGLPLINKNVKWTAIGNLFCVLAYHWLFVLYDVIFYGHYKELRNVLNFLYRFLSNLIQCGDKVENALFLKYMLQKCNKNSAIYYY